MFTQRMLIVGESGSGKTHLATRYAAALMQHKDARRRPRHVVVVSKDPREKSPLAQLTETHAEVSQRTADMNLDLRAAIVESGSVFFELTAHNPRRFLQQLGNAVLSIGGLLVVFDEAQSYLTSQAPTELLDVYSRGRKFGVHVVTITPSIKQRGTFGLHRVATNEHTSIVTFRKSEPHELRMLLEYIPEATEDLIRNLAGPNDGKPEYVVRDKLSGRVSVSRRAGVQELSQGVKHG